VASLDVVTTRSLTREEAVRRARLVDVTSYDVRLELTEGETFGSRTTIRFDCTEPGAGTFVELADALGVTARLNERAVPMDGIDGNRISLTSLESHNELVVEAILPCVTSGDGMHRYVDPADGATYVSAFCGMALAQRVFACFDQPDLKAAITLTVDAPEDWTILASGCPTGAEGRVRNFAATPPISTYLFVVCAGPWHSVTWEHRDLPFAWHARRSLAAELDRDAAELRRITERCFDAYADLFDEPFPFESYDQVMAPGQNWGALETPGCVTFRDELLFHGEASEGDRQLRAMIICHEMAHMWFGDLVTMRWWEDSWLSESFADYMGFRTAADAAGYGDAWPGFSVLRKPGAYEADERRSTHPVAPRPESVTDVDAAFGNFDQLTYAKGNSVLRQLVTWLGEDTFLRGANTYLTRHRLGNAELDDFLRALDEASDRDVFPWAEAWLQTTGFDTMNVRRDPDGVPVLSRTGSRPHRMLVTALEATRHGLVQSGQQWVDLADEPVRFEEWAGLLVVPNSHDHTYARLRPDPETWQALADHLSDIDDVAIRAVVWATAFDLVRCAELDPADLVRMVGTHLPVEDHPVVFEAVLSRMLNVDLPRHFDTLSATRARAALADACAATLATETRDRALRLAATRGLSRTSSDGDLLRSWLDAGATDADVRVVSDLRWRVVRRLAELGAVDEDTISAERAADPSSQSELGAACARAALPEADAKRRAWELVSSDNTSNRVFTATFAGFWVPEQADLLAPYIDRYLAEAPDWANRRGQGFSLTIGEVLPPHAVDMATLAGLRAALRRDVPTVLRRQWEDALDDLVAALRVRGLSGSPGAR
jgi:aminopeptidase N